MRKVLLTGAAVLAIGAAAGGVAVTRAGAHSDPAALMLALHDQATPAGPVHAPPITTDDGDDMLLAQAGPPPGTGPAMPPPPPPMAGRPGMPGPAMPRPGMPEAGGWMHGSMHPGWGWHGRMWHHAQMFGLFFHKEDKQLTPADVQKIAEAFLLWQGNRDWKVTQVAAGPDGKIGFAFATADGGVIARFTMDSRTGRLQRVG